MKALQRSGYPVYPHASKRSAHVNEMEVTIFEEIWVERDIHQMVESALTRMTQDT